MYFIRRDAGVYFNPSADGRDVEHWIFHYFGKIAGAKAWEGKLWNEPSHLRGEVRRYWAGCLL